MNRHSPNQQPKHNYSMTRGTSVNQAQSKFQPTPIDGQFQKNQQSANQIREQSAETQKV